MNNFLKRFLGFIVCFVMVSGLSTGANATSAATQGSVATQTGRVIADGRYNFVSSSNRNMALALNLPTNNVEIGVSDIKQKNQLWDVKWNDSKQAYEIRSADVSYDYSFLTRGFPMMNTNVTGQPGPPGDHSWWKATQNPEGSFSFQNYAPLPGPDWMLDTNAGHTSPGTNVLVRERSWETSQNWFLTQVLEVPCMGYPDPSCTGRVIADGKYRFGSALNPNMMLSLHGNSNVEIRSDDITQKNQLWDVKWIRSEQAYTITNTQSAHSTDYLTKDLNNTQVYGTSYYSFDRSLWKATENIDGSFSFQTKHGIAIGTNWMLDTYAGQTHDGNNVLVSERNGATSQNWILTEAPCVDYPEPSCAGQIIADGKYSFRSSSDQNMALDLNTVNNNVEIRLRNTTPETQLWDVKWIDSAQAYEIRSANPNFSNRVLSRGLDMEDTNVYAHKPTIALLNNSFWKATQNPDDSFRFQTKHAPPNGPDLMLDLYAGRTTPGTNVLVRERNEEPSQNWILTPEI